MITPLLDPAIVVATSSLIGLVVIAAALLRAWNGWLELKRQELERKTPAPARTPDAESPGLGTARIELADLKERIRKLEAIASGVEL